MFFPLQREVPGTHSCPLVWIVQSYAWQGMGGYTAHGGCLCHFSVAVLQHHDTGDCRKLKFILAYGTWGVRGLRYYLERGMCDSRQMQRLELEAEGMDTS